MDKKSKNKGINKGYDNLIPLKKGETANPNGRPKGQRNYKTIYREALIKLGSLNNKSPEDLEVELISSGFTQARKGNYQFYKDMLDRLHGQAVARTEQTNEKKENVYNFFFEPQFQQNIKNYDENIKSLIRNKLNVQETETTKETLETNE